jgi:pimeloyl-ACP methyl ester carboxylesterase
MFKLFYICCSLKIIEMKSTSHILKITFCILFALNNTNFFGQTNWVSYSQKIDTKNYIGHHFKFHGLVRALCEDDSAWAGLWVRIDTRKGNNFFENMGKTPIHNNAWKEYFIEGEIKDSSVQIAFGVLCMMNGKFYFDNLKFEVETGKEEWETLFANDFEDNKNKLQEGIQKGTSGYNTNFKAVITNAENSKSTKCLLIEGENVPNYGSNKKTGKYADVNGIKLYYEIYGQGQPLVVLHGNGGSIENATVFYPELIKKYKVIAIDSRGQGKSGDTEKPLTYEQMASDVNELLEQLKIDSAYIWGHSDGAILGLILAMDYPKKVKKLLAYGANIQPDSLAVFDWSIKYLEKVCKESKDKKNVKLCKLMLDHPNIPYSKLSAIKAPILIMAGDRDVIRPEHTLKLFQNIPNSQLCILPSATHGGAREKKELFLSIMDDFFNKPFVMPDTKSWFSSE